MRQRGQGGGSGGRAEEAGRGDSAAVEAREGGTCCARGRRRRGRAEAREGAGGTPE